MKKQNRVSILARIRTMSRSMMIGLTIPVGISLILMLIFSESYNRSIDRINRIVEIRPVIATEISEAVWDVIIGRKSLDESPMYELIHTADDTMAEIQTQTGENDRLALTVARRTMNTLEEYVDTVRDNVLNGIPTVESELVLEEVRGVASLVDSMLINYVAQEIKESAVMSTRLTGIVFATAGAELLLVIMILLMSRKAMKTTERSVREPIEQLESVTEKLAHGDLRARIPETEVTELRNLTDQVNGMADNLEELMRQSVVDERNLKKAELRTLQAQINPHFLYNTLDAIVWKAEAGEEEGVIHLTRALSDFFRISLSSGADWIPIRQEKKHIAGYLSIQQTRYRDILKYEIDIPDELGEYYVLKLLLQPLVENALYHGIKFKRGGGMIRVKAEKQQDMLLFTVSDTGIGMSPEQLETVRKRIQERQPAHATGAGGFGLANVNLRLRLYYNATEGLHIESGPAGTSISFRVPCRTEESLAHDQSISG